MTASSSPPIHPIVPLVGRLLPALRFVDGSLLLASCGAGPYRVDATRRR